MRSILAAAASAPAALGLSLGVAASAQADSPVVYRFHAVHNAFSGDAEICGIPA